MQEARTFADWFSTWCKGCKRIFPDLSKIASQCDKKPIKFIKVNTDKLKALAKVQQVKALPQVRQWRCLLPSDAHLCAGWSSLRFTASTAMCVCIGAMRCVELHNWQGFAGTCSH